MRVVIAGGRYATESQTLAGIEGSGLADKITTVVCGGAAGADSHGRAWAERKSIPVELFEANWDAHGRAAGPIRNREMAAASDGLIAIWDGDSRGTKNMIGEANKKGLVVFIHTYAMERP